MLRKKTDCFVQLVRLTLDSGFVGDARTWHTFFGSRPGSALCHRQMLFSEYAVRFCTVTLLFSASNCISVGGPFRIKKVVEFGTI